MDIENWKKEKSGEELVARLFRHYERGLITMTELQYETAIVAFEVTQGLRHAANLQPIS